MRLGIACASLLAAALALGAGAALAPGVALAQEADGQALFKTNCAQCHGEKGVPPGYMLKALKNLPTLADPATLKGLSEDSMVTVMENGKGTMAGFKDKLTHEQEVAIVKYIRTLATPAKTPAKKPG
ncbi:MAG: c-type cytochrome, partial [Gemmatimonadota bacterium]